MEPCKCFILILLIFTSMEVLDGKFTSKNCDLDEPNLHFPFKITSFCKQNKTIISFPPYGDLIVKSVLYDPKKLTLIDPKDCVFEVFLNLNLDPTPFSYYHVVKNFTYLNCSIRLSHSFEEVPCLSGSKHHVYVVESSLDVPISCEVMKTVSIPFAYSSFVSDDSFGLDLTWDLDGFQEAKRGWFGFQSIGEELSIVVLIFVVVGLAWAKIYFLKKSSSKKRELEKLLGDLETL